MNALPSRALGRWPAGSVLGMCIVFATTDASGQSTVPAASDQFSLDAESCPDVSSEAIRHILRIEIGDLLVARQERGTASHRLSIRCADDVAWVEAAGKDGASPVNRTLQLKAFPRDAAPRALALSGLELLAALSPAVRARMEANQKPPAGPVPAQPVAVDPEPRRIFHVGVAGSWRKLWAGPGLSTWGGQVQVGWILRPWRIHADIEAGGASRNVQLGSTSAFLFSGSAGFGLAGSSLHWASTIVVGARMGMARLAGSASDQPNVIASSVVRPWGGPMASLGLMGLFRPWALFATVEAGRSLFLAEGQSDGTTVLAVGGTWMAISLGAAVAP